MSARPLPPSRPFTLQPTLADAMLRLRALEAADIDALARAAASPAIWAQHPARDRYRRDVFEPYTRDLLAAGGTLVVTEQRSGAIIGCSRFYVGPDAPEDIAIGFTFLNDAWWGGDTNFRMKSLMLEHAFGTFDRVWFHIAPENLRSQKATAKLGAARKDRTTLDLGFGAKDLLSYLLTRDAWAAAKAARPGAGQ